MTNHGIPDEVRNSTLEYCFDEYIRNESHRSMLRDKWFLGMSIESIAEKYGISTTAVKSVVYDKGDRILILASDMQRSEGKSVSVWQRIIRSIRKQS